MLKVKFSGQRNSSIINASKYINTTFLQSIISQHKKYKPFYVDLPQTQVIIHVPTSRHNQNKTRSTLLRPLLGGHLLIILLLLLLVAVLESADIELIVIAARLIVGHVSSVPGNPCRHHRAARRTRNPYRRHLPGAAKSAVGGRR